MGDRNVPDDLRAIDEFMKRGSTGLDVVRALAKRGFPDIAAAVLSMQKGKVAGDYLQTSAVYTDKFEVISAINYPNDYQGPGTGYRLEGQRWELLKNIPQAIDPETI
jgi:propanediol dehydratase large subunit